MDPEKVWKSAGITGNDLGFVLESAFSILSSISEKELGKKRTLPSYSGKDVPEIIRCYQKSRVASVDI